MSGPPSDFAGADDPTVLRCEGTADFLAALPALTGFTATNSLFLVLFEGKRSSRAMRIDLPTSDRPSDTGPYLDWLCQLVEQTGAGPHGPAVVITSDTSFGEAGGVPWQRFAKRLERRFEREGWWLREVACVAPDGWASYGDPRVPPGGHPLSLIRRSPIVERSRHLDRPPHALGDLGVVGPADPVLAAAVATALADGPRDPADVTFAHALETIVRVGEALSAEADLSHAATIAEIVCNVENPGCWVLVAFTAITRPEFVAMLAHDLGEEGFARLSADRARGGGWSLEGLLASAAEEPPDREKLRRAIDVFGACAAHAPSENQAAILALLAWAWWMLGLQSVADRVSGRALDLAPGHPLAAMVRRLSTHVPAWHFAERMGG